MTPERKADALRRLKSARGHLDGVIKMIESDAYCVDIMRQLSGVRAALDKVSKLALRNHFENCFADAIRTGNEGPVIDELMSALAYDKTR